MPWLLNLTSILPFFSLSAGLMRQATYTTTRLGVFQWLEDTYKAKQKPGEQSSFLVKLAMGMAAGGIGAMVGTPAEVALIRMTSDGRLPVAERRGYKNVFDAMIRIIREEGLLTLWRGWQPTVARAMILNAAQLGVYSQAKQLFVSKAGLKVRRFPFCAGASASRLLTSFRYLGWYLGSLFGLFGFWIRFDRCLDAR
jgi:hypothetical protein